MDKAGMITWAWGMGLTTATLFFGSWWMCRDWNRRDAAEERADAERMGRR